jgi:uncharacterized protein (DUF2164 family)
MVQVTPISPPAGEFAHEFAEHRREFIIGVALDFDDGCRYGWSWGTAQTMWDADGHPSNELEEIVDSLKLSDDERRECLRRIQRYFRDERGEDLGELAQLLIYEFFAEELAPSFYNKGLGDARGRIEQLLTGIGEDLEAWERFPSRQKRKAIGRD